MNKRYENLHVHTLASDGTLSHEKVLDVCAENNISVVAFTDHDSVPDEKAIETLEKNRDHPTKWILGTEISSGWPEEIGGAASNFHIVGLFVDPHERNLQKHCQRAKEARIERMERMVKNLKDLGFDLSKEACLRESNGETVGRPHIVSALKKKKGNLKIIKALKNKMKAEAKKDQKVRRKYEVLKRRPDQAPYILFLSPNAFLKGVFLPYLYFKNMDQSVNLIRRAGGAALLAHWTFCRDRIPARMVERFFEQGRLDGAEIVFGMNKKGKKEESQIEKDMETMKNLTRKWGVLQSGGGDSHTREDLERFGEKKRFARRTVGLTARMLKKKDLNLEFSSLDKDHEGS